MNQSNQQGRRRRFLTLALGLPLALFTLVATPTLAAKRIHVDCAHGADLQAAIDAAASGSTLHVKGTCTGQFTISKDLVLEGHGKRATLDGGNAGPVLTIQEGSTVQVVRLTITHGDTAFDGG